MDKLVKGFIEIPLRDREIEEKYQTRICSVLYGLLASYGAIPREIYEHSDDWHHQMQWSLRYEEPSETMSEQDILEDEDKRDLFLKHHENHGWNKMLSSIEGSHQEIHDDSYATDKDYMHWVRVADGEHRNIDAYILKFFKYDWCDTDGCKVLNGVAFAGPYSEELFEKIERVITRFIRVLDKRRQTWGLVYIECPDWYAEARRHEQTATSEEPLEWRLRFKTD